MKLVHQFALYCSCLSMTAFAAEASDLNGFYVEGTYHRESRDGERSGHGEFLVGYDRLLFPEAHIFAGLRMGLFQESLLTFTSTTQSKVFGGVQTYALFPLGMHGLKTGLSFDVLKGDEIDPLYLGIGFNVGPRFTIPTIQNLYVEIPIGYQFFPGFDGIPHIFKAGLQVGYNF